MKYVSLFSGIGGFDSAFDQIGGTCVLASEIDKYAIQSFEALYNFTPYGDVTELDAFKVPNHDILLAGFPCQAFTMNGKRLGFEDTRGTLFFEVARIARWKRPKVILIENVKGLLSHDKGRTLEVMLDTLCKIGYTLDFELLNSKFAGVPHNRERIYIVAVRNDLVEESAWLRSVNKSIDKRKLWLNRNDTLRTFNFNWPLEGNNVPDLLSLIEKSPDFKFYVTDDRFTRLLHRRIGHIIVEEATSEGFKIATIGDTINIGAPHSKTRRGRVGRQVANTLLTGIEQAVVVEDPTTRYGYKLRMLTPLDCWRLQGFTDEQFYKAQSTGLSNSQLYKQAGNAVTVPLVKEIGLRLKKYL
jgi:DNA (cytosine-5)-methyltransferase 1